MKHKGGEAIVKQRKKDARWAKTYKKKIYSDPIKHCVFKAKMAQHQRNRIARLMKDPEAYEKYSIARKVGRQRWRKEGSKEEEQNQ